MIKYQERPFNRPPDFADFNIPMPTLGSDSLRSRLTNQAYQRLIVRLARLDEESPAAERAIADYQKTLTSVARWFNRRYASQSAGSGSERYSPGASSPKR